MKNQKDKTPSPEAPTSENPRQSNLIPLNIDRFVGTIKKQYRSWDAPVVTLIASHGGGPFEVLVATILSLRTKDEVTAVAAKRILAKADTPEKMLALDEKTIEKEIYPVGFYPTKAKQLRQISRILIEQYNGQVPNDMDALLALPGVGRKTANLVLAEGFGQAAICVDTHVHRISNRIGYVKTKIPEQTEFASGCLWPGDLPPHLPMVQPMPSGKNVPPGGGQ